MEYAELPTAISGFWGGGCFEMVVMKLKLVKVYRFEFKKNPEEGSVRALDNYI
jgi:hypothetical protein